MINFKIYGIPFIIGAWVPYLVGLTTSISATLSITGIVILLMLFKILEPL